MADSTLVSIRLDVGALSFAERTITENSHVILIYRVSASHCSLPEWLVDGYESMPLVGDLGGLDT